MTANEIIKMLIMDFFFENASGDALAIFEYVAARVSTQSSRDILGRAISIAMGELCAAGAVAFSNERYYPNTVYFSSSRQQWVDIQEMGTIHITNASQRILRESVLRRTELRNLINELGRRANAYQS